MSPYPEEDSDDYRTLVLQEANRLCHLKLEFDPDHPQTLRLRALMSMRRGRWDVALACLERVSQREPTNADVLADYGEALTLGGRVDEAELAYRRAVLFRPQDAELQARLARFLAGRGQHAEARERLLSAVQFAPSSAAHHAQLADLLYAMGRRTEAVELQTQALALEPEDGRLHARCGQMSLSHGEIARAEALFRRGLALDPGVALLHRGLGEILLRQGCFKDSIAALVTSLLLDITDVDTHRLYVCALELAGRTAEAADAWHALGATHAFHERFSAAAEAYEEVIRRKPDHFRALLGLGQMLLHLDRPREAREHLASALKSEPRHGGAHQLFGAACAIVGDLATMWREVAWFDRCGPWNRFEQPWWNGEPIADRTILLWTNAGLGDAIQGARFIPLVKPFGAHIVVECEPALVPLFSALEYIDHVVGRGLALPAFDIHAPVSTAAHVCGTTWTTIPARTPYFSIDRGAIERWRPRFERLGDIKVGLAWAGGTQGDARIKSIPLILFGPLARVPGVRFIALQIGASASEQATPPRGMKIARLLKQSASIVDTASLIRNLDLVISVDTMISHLAGSLGAPVWIVLKHPVDWRWSYQQDTTPWYPTMRLFRQKSAGDWPSVMKVVATELESFVRISADNRRSAVMASVSR